MRMLGGSSEEDRNRTQSRRRRSVGWRWTRCTSLLAWPIIVSTIGISGLCSPFAASLLERTTSKFGSAGPSEKASERLKKWYPGTASTSSLVVLVSRSTCAWENEFLASFFGEFGASCQECFVRSVTSACALRAINATYVAEWYERGDESMIQIVYSSKNRKLVNEMISWVSERDPPRVQGGGLGITGFDAFAQEASSGVRDDLKMLDTMSLPLALAIFALVVGYLPLVVIPLSVMICSTLIAFALTAQVALYFPIASFAPSVMTTITIALCFDYSLFISFRYVETRKNVKLLSTSTSGSFRRPNFLRVLETVSSACETIAVSALTLFCCFLGLLAFPSGLVSGVGIALAVGLVSAATVALTLAPAILHVAGEQLCDVQDATIDRIFCRKNRRRPPAQPSSGVEFTRNDNPLLVGPLVEDDYHLAATTTTTGNFMPANSSSSDSSDSEGEDDEDDLNELKRSFWYRLGEVLWEDRRYAIAAILGVVVACIPLVSFLWRPGVVLCADPVGLAPSPSPPERTLVDLEASFGAGVMAQFTVLFESPEGSAGVIDDHSLNATDELLSEIAGKDDTVLALSRIGSRRLHATDYARCAGDTSSALCASLSVMAKSFVSGSASIAHVALRRNPYSRRGLRWIAQARKRISRQRYFEHVSLSGSAAALKDVIDSLYRVFPAVIAATLAVVFVLLGAVFRSVAVALRSVLSLLLTLTFSFGTCVATYVITDSGPAFVTTRGADPGLVWMAPLMCFSIVIALSVDYDIFLLCAVHEHRFRKRFSDRSSLLRAMRRTGLVVTSAGQIMAVAFGGLFFSKACVLNQVAWLLVSAVLFDTFVVRALFMPALISLSREYAWWPSSLPLPAKRDDAHDYAPPPSLQEEGYSPIRIRV